MHFAPKLLLCVVAALSAAAGVLLLERLSRSDSSSALPPAVNWSWCMDAFSFSAFRPFPKRESTDCAALASGSNCFLVSSPRSGAPFASVCADDNSRWSSDGLGDGGSKLIIGVGAAKTSSSALHEYLVATGEVGTYRM